MESLEELTYIWPGAQGELRWKTRIAATANNDKPIPWWSFDASSTMERTPNDDESTELYLQPVKLFQNPFGGGRLVLCEVMSFNRNQQCFTPAKCNTRALVRPWFCGYDHLAPWFGIEQEYFLARSDNPLFDSESPLAASWEPGRLDHYCNLTLDKKEPLDIAETHLRLCMQAGVAIGGLNAEVVPFQYEFQIGHIASLEQQLQGIDAADHLCIARFILEKLAIQRGYKVIYDPKPFPKTNGSGAHINYSDTVTRSGQNLIKRIAQLEVYHLHNLRLFGTNHLRLTGQHETSDPTRFSYGFGTRNTTVRIPANQIDYFEYRLPAADMDPYVCTGVMFAEMIADTETDVLDLINLVYKSKNAQQELRLSV